MREDFQAVKEQLKKIGIVKISNDFYRCPLKKGGIYFVKSPISTDKTASLALYPNTDRFCDFANGSHSGDIIGFVAYVRGCNNWDALQVLKNFYGLSDAKENEREEIKQKIRLQQEEERKRAERQQDFNAALYGYTEELKESERLYRLAIERGICMPFSALWCDCKNELQKIEYELNILCATDCDNYRRMKDYTADALPTDFYQWLIDVWELLKRKGLFTATKEERSQRRMKRVLELKKAGRSRQGVQH